MPFEKGKCVEVLICTSRFLSGTPLPTTTTSATASTTTEPIASDDSDSSNTPAIAGGVVGGVVGLCAIAAICWFLWRRKHKRCIMDETGKATQTPGELDGRPRPAEMSVQAERVELM